MRQMPKVAPPVKMEAALDVLMMVDTSNSAPDKWFGVTSFYFDEKQSMRYTSRWRLKTKEGAIERQRRETIQYLKDLRDQIDDVLAKIENAQPGEHNLISVASHAYEPRSR